MKHCDAFKYLGVVLGNRLSFNLHIYYRKKKISKTLGMFSRIRNGEIQEVLFLALLKARYCYPDSQGEIAERKKHQ